MELFNKIRKDIKLLNKHKKTQHFKIQKINSNSKFKDVLVSFMVEPATQIEPNL